MKATPAATHPGWKFAESAYEGSASLGKITGIFSSITGILIGLLLLIGGLYLAFKKNTRNYTTATIKNSECKEVVVEKDNRKDVLYNCILDISYTDANGETYEGKITTNDKNYVDGQTIKVSYHNNNPRDVVASSISSKQVGWILFGIGLVTIIGSAFSLYLTMNYKLYQAAQGVGAVANVLDKATD